MALTLALPVATEADLWRLSSKQTNRGSRLIKSPDVLPVTRAIPERSAKLVRTWASKGRTLASDDMLIAATAIEHRLTLATSNRKDFPMPEVVLYPLS